MSFKVQNVIVTEKSGFNSMARIQFQVRAFSMRVPAIWNSLSPDIYTTDS